MRIGGTTGNAGARFSLPSRDELIPWDPAGAAEPAPSKPPGSVWVLAAVSALAILIANVSGIAVGDDGVGYRAIADSLLGGNGLGYFLNDPLTIWPPVWPALMAALAFVTPLGTLGAAVVLNMITAAAATVVGYGLLARVLGDRRFVACGTAVIALGGSTIGFGHLLMTDLAFAVTVMVWLRCLIRFHRDEQWRWLAAGSLTVWFGFGLRYVAVYLLVVGCAWLLFDTRRPVRDRLIHSLVHGALGVVVPLAWMLRNHAVDGTFTGVRAPSARGPIENAFDVVATMGQWLLPGVASDALRVWAVVGLVTLALAAWLGYRVLTERPAPSDADGPVRRFVTWIGSPSGLLAAASFGYLTYMVYVRSSTALNRLELRLLNPAYFPLLALALVLAANLRRLDRPESTTWARRALITVVVWAAANLAVGLYATVAFAAGDPFFEGNYNSESFVELRHSQALEAVPAGCDTYSNLPNGLYPVIESQWSPRRTALESNATTDDLDRLIESVRTNPACLVWIEIGPDYGHLWTLAELDRALTVEAQAHDGPVTVYRVTPKG